MGRVGHDYTRLVCECLRYQISSRVAMQMSTSVHPFAGMCFERAITSAYRLSALVQRIYLRQRR